MVCVFGGGCWGCCGEISVPYSPSFFVSTTNITSKFRPDISLFSAAIPRFSPQAQYHCSHQLLLISDSLTTFLDGCKRERPRPPHAGEPGKLPPRHLLRRLRDVSYRRPAKSLPNLPQLRPLPELLLRPRKRPPAAPLLPHHERGAWERAPTRFWWAGGEGAHGENTHSKWARGSSDQRH